jgi:NAD(P)-dependent dehydrogenase (short-subunit alcohol dehydrogenase family)
MRVKDMFDLSGKTAVVTGGSIGLGAQMATGLAEAGANLVIAARKVDRCVELCNKLEGLGVRALAVACDASKADDCQNLVDVTVKEFGTLDILVNNAGITWAADAMNFPMDRWHQILNLNLTGLFQLSAMAARVMKEQGGGKIINITSLAGYGGTKPEDMNAVAYNASKGAVNTLTKDLAVKWASYGIYVNAIAPGFFPTHMSEFILEKNANIFLPQIPFGRFGGEDDLKGAVVFLSSAASNFITGQIINVDGGQMALV